MKKLLFFWKELMTTFWFLPVLILAFSIFLSISLVYLDSSIDVSGEGWVRLFLVTSSDSARSILSTISGAMIGVAGTVFSVTLVALTLASSQFGPSLVRNFMYVRLNQIVLGSYIATYLYCLLVLNAINNNDDFTFIPTISILVAIFAAVANIILLIIFIHQIAISLQADKVISDISDFISKQLEANFPKTMEEEAEIEDAVDTRVATAGYQIRISIKSPENGYLQYIDRDALTEAVSKENALLDLFHRPGNFLVKGSEIGILYSHTNWEKKKLEKILDQFVFGKTKTSHQDLEYSIHQMVEIAARALSPGINDPFTAIACIDNLTATLCYLANAKFPSKYRFDEAGNLRVIAETVDFEGILDAAFNQIRQYSKGNPAVIISLMEALITLHDFTSKESHKKAVIKHAEMVLSLGKQSIQEENDLNDLTKRAEKILNF